MRALKQSLVQEQRGKRFEPQDNVANLASERAAAGKLYLLLPVGMLSFTPYWHTVTTRLEWVL
jgi:predicted N-formylglutamate amidohydrolase